MGNVSRKLKRKSANLVNLGAIVFKAFRNYRKVVKSAVIGSKCRFCISRTSIARSAHSFSSNRQADIGKLIRISIVMDYCVNICRFLHELIIRKKVTQMFINV